MQPLASILLLVECGDRVHQGLSKALMLARYFHARLDLFLCDTEGYVRTHPGPMAAGARTRARCVADGSDYLQALRKSIVAADVEIATEAVCHRSLREAVTEKAERCAADLLVKTTEASCLDAANRSATDWAAMAECPPPLLLTRGRSWRPIPQFAAVLQVALESNRAATRAVADLTVALALACSAEVDMLWTGLDRPYECGEAARHAIQFKDSPAAVRRPLFVEGAAHDVIPAALEEGDYDLVVLEKPRLTGAAAARSLVGSVLAMCGGDVVLTDTTAPGSGYASRVNTVDEHRAFEATHVFAVRPRHED